MGNPHLADPRDEATPCWICAHFIGLHTRPFGPTASLTINCAERGRFWHVDPDRGCKMWKDERPQPIITT